MSISVFDGRIAGAGSTSGVRLVVGIWAESPLGRFCDVMVEQPDGWRLLLAPSQQVADYVASTYTFDQMVVAPVEAERLDDRWQISAGDVEHRLDLGLRIGRRTRLGSLLRLVPRPVAQSRAFCRAVDPIASRVLPGVHTVGSAGNDRTEYYAALDQHRVDGLSGSWRGEPLGELAPVTPPVRFGFGSTPATPSIQRIVTIIETG